MDTWIVEDNSKFAHSTVNGKGKIALLFGYKLFKKRKYHFASRKKQERVDRR